MKSPKLVRSWQKWPSLPGMRSNFSCCCELGPRPPILVSAESAPVTDSISSYGFAAKRSTKAPAAICSMLAFVENNAFHVRFFLDAMLGVR